MQKAKGAPVLQLRRYEAPFLPESLEALRGCSRRAGIMRALPKELRAAHGAGAALTALASVCSPEQGSITGHFNSRHLLLCRSLK